jgi:hypothetical protein
MAKKPARKSAAKKRSSLNRRSTVRRAARGQVRQTLFMPRRTAAGLASFGSLNYRAIEAEVIKLTELLHAISKKSKLVRKSLAYLEKEQKKVTRQLREAKKFLNQVKNRSIQVLRGFPGNAEEIYYQLKGEFNRLSKRLGVR